MKCFVPQLLEAERKEVTFSI